MRNPSWSRDEVILALRLYLTHRASPPDVDHPKNAELVDTLAKLHRLLGTPPSATLRNGNGVFLKMMNFRALDPQYTSQGKAGMKAGSKLDKLVWDQFAADLASLQVEADRITAAIHAAPDTPGYVAPRKEEYEANEGGVIMRLHKRYERDRTLVKRKIEAASAKGLVQCEVCDFDFAVEFGDLGDGYIEVHHLQPVHTLKKRSRTKLSDLALLCANCHRMAHRKRTPLSLDELRAARSGQNA